ncbi:N-acetylmuramoyl-L-alanine amidase family protein [Orientia chuto str. Dubai]|uniref:N-acetylmuramoyl-L-alanine amidase n=1 Tax=Orientia chuto str. Dubai TaxID=1359168 RepID=A0A0F3MJ62_9RICK|nr:N-acetylmuramoyl-L-alanine amidase [Candidatus Orientia mediorientalis]KJV55785.1 N-acetylmuramoyl-L-alanine amidase family protein [Orientia chuto str. Dubai]
MIHLLILSLLQYVIFFNNVLAVKHESHLSNQLQVLISNKHYEMQHVPIEKVDVFKRAFSFKENTGIYVSQFSDYGMTGYAIDKFSESENNRNHYIERPQGMPVKYLIMHYTHENFFNTAQIFTANKSLGQVSSHLVITEKEVEGTPGGILVSFVPENQIAYHAGISFWKNDTGLNALSIGIEHVNKGINIQNKTKKWVHYDEHQITASGIVSSGIVKRYNINPTCVLGHSDIAYNRKIDPGPLFPWGRLYHEYGVGAWLTDAELNSQYIREKYNPKFLIQKT